MIFFYHRKHPDSKIETLMGAQHPNMTINLKTIERCNYEAQNEPTTTFIIDCCY